MGLTSADRPTSWLTATGLPAGVHGLMTSREGGVSRPPFDSMNLRPATLRGGAPDDPDAIAENQRRLQAWIGVQPVYLNQVHGSAVVRLQSDSLPTRRATADHAAADHPPADASITTEPGIACTVLVADCLPVLFAAPAGRGVAAAHAGWRGLAGGVLENTVQSLCSAADCAPGEVCAWLGACIGPTAFEVGADVVEAFGFDTAAALRSGVPNDLRRAAIDADLGMSARPRFVFSPRPDGSHRWRADLAGLALDRLQQAGLTRISGGGFCTVAESSRFYSFRREPVTGRMAACIWIDAPSAA